MAAGQVQDFPAESGFVPFFTQLLLDGGRGGGYCVGNFPLAHNANPVAGRSVRQIQHGRAGCGRCLCRINFSQNASNLLGFFWLRPAAVSCFS